jgi:hypothetical protein
MPHRSTTSSITLTTARINIALYLITKQIRGMEPNSAFLLRIFNKFRKIVIHNMTTTPSSKGSFFEQFHFMITHFVVGDYHGTQSRISAIGVVFWDVDIVSVGSDGLIGYAG